MPKFSVKNGRAQAVAEKTAPAGEHKWRLSSGDGKESAHQSVYAAVVALTRQGQTCTAGAAAPKIILSLLGR